MSSIVYLAATAAALAALAEREVTAVVIGAHYDSVFGATGAKDSGSGVGALLEGVQDKHVRDIRFILAVTAVDQALLEAEVARLGLQAHWRKCLEQG